MIHTCTLNPSIDYVMHLEGFETGQLNRATKTFYYPGGKGINVSRMLSRFDTATTALGFAGGFTGQFIKSFLEEEGIHEKFIDTGDYTRINVKLKADEESEINGPGPQITREQQEQLLQQIKELHSDDKLVLAGSVPASLSNDIYIKIAEICKEMSVPLIADTSGAALEQLIGYPAFLLKPNHHELGQLFQTSIETKKQAASYAKKLIERGAKHVIVSMGGEGAVFVSDKYSYYATVPKGEVKNSVGAGDSLVSGFLAAYTKGSSLEEAFRFGVASGSATAFSDDLCKQDDVEALLSEVHISPII
ncbi:1-phosphofructokinase [Thalassobacillus pellis]|uniref:1-phosphofructokinase n=1 Tax=Thalassobacillus pellis TaxID=748008 RepID=UPI00196046C0|nr:1-phosphofructokinase [Thalassobacillus pellis]MBM7551324.1 1-phosphofructokinase [Thalassobacillus pellis]